MKRLLVEISLIMFSLKQKRRKKKRLEYYGRCEKCNEINTGYLNWCRTCTASHFQKDFSNGHQAITRLLILFKILKSMRGIVDWYWNGIFSQPFQRLKK